MLKPETNPLYRQILYDGGKKTYIKTLQQHRNQKADNNQFQWDNKILTERNHDKITTMDNNLPQISSRQMAISYHPQNHELFPLLQKEELHQIPMKYQMRYQNKSALFLSQSISPKNTESTASLIGKFIVSGNNGKYSQPPVQEPTETYKNRSRVFFG